MNDPQVLAVRYGERLTDTASVYLNHQIYGEPNVEIAMDYYFWVVRDEQRTVLVDCGFSPAGGAARDRTLLADPIESLAALGVEAAAIDLVVVSHAHYDHIGNLDRLPDVPVVMARAEYDFWTGDVADRPQFAHSVEDVELDHLRARLDDGTLRLLDDDGEVAPGVRVRIVGGHTPGQLVVEVDTAQGVLVLAADAVHYYDELDLDRPFAVVCDVPAMYRAFADLRARAERPDVVVVAGHDPAVRDRFTGRLAHLDEGLRDDVVVLNPGGEAP